MCAVLNLEFKPGVVLLQWIWPAVYPVLSKVDMACRVPCAEQSGYGLSCALC